MTWIGSTPHHDIGMTDEKYNLLKELALSKEYWHVILVTVDSTAHLQLSSLSNDQRARLASIIIELDSAIYMKSWGFDIPEIHTNSVQKTEPNLNSFNRMRSIMKRVKQ